MSFRKISQFIVFTIILFALTACSSNSESNASDSSSGESKDKITIGQINWPENIAITNMWKAILEDEGYEVELKLIEMGPQMSALAEGDLDVAPEIWLPVQDKSYYEEYKNEVTFFEDPWYENGKVGLAVPKYMKNINSIEDLNEEKEKFSGEITGFEPGAGTMITTEDMINDYGLDFELVESSEAAMITSIENAAENKDPVVAPLWKPHWIFSELDLKFLDDPKNTYGEVEKIYMATRNGFAEEHEEVNEWMKNFKLTDEQLGELMVNIKDNEDNPSKGAQKWINNNEDLIEEWIN